MFKAMMIKISWKLRNFNEIYRWGHTAGLNNIV